MSAALVSLMPEMPARPAKSASLVSFVLIGGFGAALFVALSSIAMALLPSGAEWQVNAFCYALTILPIYLLHRRFSFRSGAAHRKALPRYVAVQFMAMGLAALFSFVIYGSLRLPPVAAAVLVVGLTSGVNFLVLRGWAFASGQKPVTSWRGFASFAKRGSNRLPVG
jgi:putative flippase GtrA